MKRFIRNLILLFLVISLTLIAWYRQQKADLNSSVEGWAVLAEKDDYKDVEMSDLLVDYIDITRMRQALEDLGWDPDQIHDLRVEQGLATGDRDAVRLPIPLEHVQLGLDVLERLVRG